MEDLLPHIRQLFLPGRGGQAGEVQVDLGLTVRPMADKKHLPGDHVSWHKVPQLRILFLHEIPGFAVPKDEQPSALSPGGFTDEHSLSWDPNRRGVILDKLQISKFDALGKNQGSEIAGIGDGSCGKPGEDSVHSPAAQDYRAGTVQQAAGIGIPNDQPAAAAVLPLPLYGQIFRQMVGKTMDQSGVLPAAGFVDQGGHQDLPGAAFGIGGPFFLLSAEIAQDQTFLFHLEGRSQRKHPPNDLRGVLRQSGYRVGVRQVYAAFHGVGKVFGRRIVLPHGIESRVDPALSQNRLGPLRGQRGDKIAGNSRLSQMDGSRQPGKPGAHDVHSPHETVSLQTDTTP